MGLLRKYLLGPPDSTSCEVQSTSHLPVPSCQEPNRNLSDRLCYLPKVLHVDFSVWRLENLQFIGQTKFASARCGGRKTFMLAGFGKADRGLKTRKEAVVATAQNLGAHRKVLGNRQDTTCTHTVIHRLSMIRCGALWEGVRSRGDRYGQVGTWLLGYAM